LLPTPDFLSILTRLGLSSLAISDADIFNSLQIPTNSSYPISEILATAPESYPFFFQLYVLKDKNRTKSLLQEVTSKGVKAIFVTVDLPVISKREVDIRIKQTKAGKILPFERSSGIDPSLSWDDIAWIRKQTHLPIILKGIQSAADARRAMQLGCQGIVVSNHGGRALDNAQPAILTLLELQYECPEIFTAMEVMIDGGIRRGSDILKALCLGARAVGLGRSFLYGVNYGQEGIEHVVNSMSISFLSIFNMNVECIISMG
jgi:L-lactate dehydrogenase (cytochrome)